MNITIRKLTTAVALILCAASPTQLLADQFTVDTTIDPDFVDASNCMYASGACSLRDALAAADETPGDDNVDFDVDDTIYLTRKLTVNEKVTIDGGDGTIVRVDQGYEIKTLPDRQANPTRPGLCGEMVCPDLPVLQPVYRAEGNGARAMLELRGDGTVVKNMVIDGSITPEPADLGVGRIDFNSNNATDFFLFTTDSDGDGTGDRWLVAGGIKVDFIDFGDFPGQRGFVEVHGNELRNFATSALIVDNSRGAEIKENIIFGGAAGQPFFSGAGISMFIAEGAVVSGNTVSQYREGFSATIASGATVKANAFERNSGVGVAIEFADSSINDNVVEVNHIADNDVGIKFSAVADGLIANNIVTSNRTGIVIDNRWSDDVPIPSERNKIRDNSVSSNSEFGIIIALSNDNNIEANTVNENGSDPFGQGGIALIFGAQGNHVKNNEVSSNFGLGIAVEFGSQDNVVANNVANNNVIGIILGNQPLAPGVIVEGNLVESNAALNNSYVDLLDSDSVCNDTWSDNTFGTSASASANCID